MPASTGGNWYATNEGRAYPLDDAATARDDVGHPVPTDVLVDLALRWPDALGDSAYLSGMTVTATAVSLTFAACAAVVTPSAAPGATPGAAGTGTPLAAVTVAQPVTPYTTVAVTPLAAGVGGWVALGSGCDRPYAGWLSTAAQGALLPRCATSYPPPPLAGLGKPYLPAMTDVVTLTAGTDVAVDIESRSPGGLAVTAVVLRLRPAVSGSGADVYQQYAGPCGGRPESNSCAGPAGLVLPDILTVAGVEPDPLTGNVNLSFPGATAYPLAGGGGLAIAYAGTLASRCPPSPYQPDPATGQLPGDTAAAATQCGPDVTFAATPPAGFTVVSGLFASSASGYAAADAGLNLSVAAWTPAPATFAVNFTLTYPALGGVTGGLGFGFQDASHPYGVAWLDGLAGTLNLGTVVPGSNPAAAASRTLPVIPNPRTPYPWSGQSAVLSVTLAPSIVAGHVFATAYLVSLVACGTVAADLPLANTGTLGPFTWGGATTFLSLHTGS